MDYQIRHLENCQMKPNKKKSRVGTHRIVIEIIGTLTIFIQKHFYVPHHRGGGGGGGGAGHIVFSADPVGVNVASCLHSISLMNGWILAKLQIFHWVGENAD